MICEICYAVRNTNRRHGALVGMTVIDGQVMCYRCAVQALDAKEVNNVSTN